MRIGLILQVDDKGGELTPRWHDIVTQAAAAEELGFDLVVLADALTEGPANYWEAMSLAGALAASTSRIGISHSVVNAPMRPPALVARAAQTLDEISNGRYTLGIGAGNTPDDYQMFGIDADPRYSRFEESLEVIHALLREQAVDFAGEYEQAHTSRFVPTGPRPRSIPINVAAGGPKMVSLTARLADQWNWWAGANGQVDHLEEIIETLDDAIEDEGRDPESLVRTLDVYSFDPLGVVADPPAHVRSGRSQELAESLLLLDRFDIAEVRVDLAPVPLDRRIDAISAMAPVVESLHGH